MRQGQQALHADGIGAGLLAQQLAQAVGGSRRLAQSRLREQNNAQKKQDYYMLHAGGHKG
ncbi:hypothetical protein GCM10011375_20910 [Hymenobacter qilianensis]|uniref:Uncharacterized protein n=1 Tax=Hymenobacter qilianensis TaxID=1385715 RepID=A0ACB5PRT2_9BACT|nr:hypothetical protein GCM10011375_20910 [Hymenobacter qilianensis]